jgi:chaperonin cofactor prefoldin
MTKEETEVYFRNMNALVRSSGWLTLLEELYELEDVLNEITSVETERDLYYRKGQLQMVHKLINLEDELKITQEAFEADESP